MIFYWLKNIITRLIAGFEVVLMFSCAIEVQMGYSVCLFIDSNWTGLGINLKESVMVTLMFFYYIVYIIMFILGTAKNVKYVVIWKEKEDNRREIKSKTNHSIFQTSHLHNLIVTCVNHVCHFTHQSCYEVAWISSNFLLPLFSLFQHCFMTCLSKVYPSITCWEVMQGTNDFQSFRCLHFLFPLMKSFLFGLVMKFYPVTVQWYTHNQTLWWLCFMNYQTLFSN